MDLQIKNKAIREILAWIIYPIVFGGGLYVSYYMLYVANLPEEYTAVVAVIAFVIIGIMEHVSPYRVGWNIPQGDVVTDVFYVIIYQVYNSIERIFAPAMGVYALRFLPQQTSNLWPHQWSVFFQVILAIHIVEFFQYWLHRWGHKVPLLWRLHAVHHSPERLWFANAPRFHIIEIFYNMIFSTALLYILGADSKIISLVVVFISIHGLFQHCNIYFKIGIFNYFFSQAELHRWHHSRLIEESDTNFGNNVIFWDILFGTFFWPKEREIATIGLVGTDYPKGYKDQLLAPFHKDFIDKPKDFKGREAYYEDLIKQENKRVSKELGINN
jgi:sterol desaturase/sphingolipid hydroxylase (fatty acid hydroxylase superfamily)